MNENLTLQHIHEDIKGMKQQLQLLSNILSEEKELSDWAKQELTKARTVPDSDLVDLKEARRRILR